MLRAKDIDIRKLVELAVRAVDRDSIERERALDEVWNLASDGNSAYARAVARLIARALVTDSCDIIRSDAVEVLAGLGTSSDIRAVIECLDDREWVVRASAVSSVAGLLGKRGVPRIRKMLCDKHEVVRKYAAVALYDAIGCDAADELRDILPHENDPNARIGILSVLATCGSEQAINELKALTKHPTARIYESARRVLRDLEEGN